MKRQQLKQQPPPSPSWRSLKIRSSSLPRIRAARRNSLNSTGRSWAQSIFSGSSPSRNEKSLSPPRSPRKLKWRRTPVLTLALLKLDEQMFMYCRLLADPSLENARQACFLLDSSVATASPSSSPRTPSSSPMSSPNASNRSPIRNWLTGGGTGESPPNANVSTSALALEGEWEKFVMPLFLLAGAEAIYAGLGHAEVQVASNLFGLYQRIAKDLQLVRETLCDPFLHLQAHEHSAETPALAIYYERASSLHTSLICLTTLCSLRCQLLTLEKSLWDASPKPNFKELSRLFQERLPDVPREAARASPMRNALEREIQAWKCLMDTASSLEQCRFAETILSAQKTKSLLERSSQTSLQIWLHETLQNLISIFPIVFDRIEAFAKPLYGFNESLMDNPLPNRLGPAQDLEQQILEFLRKQEKAGGPAIAVSVVLDAVHTCNLRVERGFTLQEQTSTSPLKESEVVSLEWPAVYMRTTTHHGLTASQSVSGILGGMRRTKGSATRGSKDSFEGEATLKPTRSTSTSILRSWSADTSSPRVVGHKKPEEKRLNILEYSPDSGSSAWPHSAWNSMVALLTGNGEELPPSPIPEHPSMERASFGNIEENLKSLSLPKWPGSAPITSPESQPNSPSLPALKRKMSTVCETTSFHISHLSDFMWLVIMVKGEEESRWHIRRSRTVVEDEVREFLNKTAPVLRIGDWFAVYHVHKLRVQKIKALKSQRQRLFKEIKKERSWSDANVQELFESLKEAFGLSSPRAPLVDASRSTYIGGFRALSSLSPSFWSAPRTARSQDDSFDASASAAFFFLGPVLANTIGSH